MSLALTAANFAAEVLQADRTVLVDFWAPWCGPCRMIAPEVDALAAEKGEALKVGKVNVDEAPDLAAEYGITSIPAILVFKGGALVAQTMGYQTKDDLARLL